MAADDPERKCRFNETQIAGGRSSSLARTFHTFRVSRQRNSADTRRAPIPAVGGIDIPCSAGIKRNAVAVDVSQGSPKGYEKSGLVFDNRNAVQPNPIRLAGSRARNRQRDAPGVDCSRGEILAPSFGAAISQRTGASVLHFDLLEVTGSELQQLQYNSFASC